MKIKNQRSSETVPPGWRTKDWGKYRTEDRPQDRTKNQRRCWKIVWKTIWNINTLQTNSVLFSTPKKFCTIFHSVYYNASQNFRLVVTLLDTPHQKKWRTEVFLVSNQNTEERGDVEPATVRNRMSILFF